MSCTARSRRDLTLRSWSGGAVGGSVSQSISQSDRQLYTGIPLSSRQPIVMANVSQVADLAIQLCGMSGRQASKSAPWFAHARWILPTHRSTQALSQPPLEFHYGAIHVSTTGTVYLSEMGGAGCTPRTPLPMKVSMTAKWQRLVNAVQQDSCCRGVLGRPHLNMKMLQRLGN
jgi:hypothetical protein